ncbi:MAG: flagellar motor switch protein FliG [Planctomycetes bacterium]|nr:flagellar motor switch protein FliG [Planctomycetota bacterium]
MDLSNLSGLQKSAILLLSIDPDTAAKILARLSPDDIEKISMEIAKTDEVPRDVREQVVKEFYNTSLERKFVEEGGFDMAKALLERSVDPSKANQILGNLKRTLQTTPFHFLRKADTENLLTFIKDEHPQTIALIMAYLTPGKAAEILQGLAPKIQLEVVKRISKMEQTNQDAIKAVEEGLESRVSAFVSTEQEVMGGVESVADMLNLADRSTEKGILENLEEDDPELVEQIRKLMFVFEDIMNVNDKGIQQVLKEIDNDELAVALKAASEDLKGKIFKNMSERAAEMVREEMEYMGPVRVADVEAAQQRIVDVVRRLEESGEIIIQGRGDEDVI